MPKELQTLVTCTFAMSVGFYDPEAITPSQLRSVQNPPTLGVLEGTAIAIDDHHLLTAAHFLGYDISIRKYPAKDLVSVYLLDSLHLTFQNPSKA